MIKNTCGERVKEDGICALNALKKYNGRLICTLLKKSGTSWWNNRINAQVLMKTAEYPD